MDIITTSSYEDLSKTAAEYIIQKVRKESSVILGMATGGTPTKMYELLIDDYVNHKTSYNHVTTFNLDEYVGLSKNDSKSYYSYMNNQLFKHIDINKNKTHIPDGLAENIEQECGRYEQLLQNNGPVDVQILGLGENGHIGFNEPRTPFDSKTHVVKLTDSTRRANARFFKSLEDVPTHAITMGIDSIMQAKEILLLVSGEHKAEALNRLLHGEISENFPASILKKHPCVKIIADRSVLEHSSIIA
jgi:glucosamine-6-phosphate deaminase